MGGIPTLPKTQEGVTEQEMPHTNAARPHRHQCQKPNLLLEEEGEEVSLHLPLQNGQEEQIQMTTLQPTSLVKVAGIGDAGEQRED